LFLVTSTEYSPNIDRSRASLPEYSSYRDDRTMTATPKGLPETPGRGLPPLDPADVLSDVLRVIHLSGAIFFHADVAAPWAARTVSAADLARVLLPGARQLALFHVIEHGHCWIALDGADPLELAAGDVVLLPYGDEHTLGSDLSLAPMPMKRLLKPTGGSLSKLVFGRGTHRTRVICGFLQCGELLFSSLWRALPEIIHVKPSEEHGSSLLASTVRSIADEVSAAQSGAACVLSRLAELLFIEVLRRHMANLEPDAVGWLSALNDPVVGRALQLLHARPAYPWTVSGLARQVGASRSLLADRFRSMVGQPPMHYLACWRLQLAAEMMRNHRHGIAAVAAHVGYDSEAAFNRAFKRRLGEPPAAFRNRTLSLPNTPR
jgi:AraC family transcriptional regulator, alkane utilization regulator